MSRQGWYPASDLEELIRQHQARTPVSGASGRHESVKNADWLPAVDASETAEAFVIEIELTGVGRDSIDVAVREGALVIQGERPVPDGSGRRYHRMERPRGHFIRRFELPDNVEMSGIDAEYADGMLVLTLPKHRDQPPETTRIQIR